VSPRFFTPALLLRKSDAELAALVTAGHEAAFTAIVLRHRAYLLRHCRGVLRDQRAEDAVQQAFVRALQALRSGTEVRELRPWLHRIAHNVALSELAAGRRDHAELNEAWEDHSRSGEYDRRLALRETLVAVDALPDRQRDALVRSAAGDTPALIARDLGVTTVAARQLVHRARLSVRAAVRVVCPPPLILLARRAAVTWERIPRVAGVPAGAAPVASKIAIAVVASATVAAPATVIHSVLTHRRHPGHHVRVVASRPVTAAAFLAPRAEDPVRQVSLSSTMPAAPPPRAPSAPEPASPASTSPGNAPGVSASSPNSAPVGSGSSSVYSSAGAPTAGAASASGASGSSASGLGPTATDAASSPTEPSSPATDSGGTTTTSSDASSTDSSSAGTSADASGAASGSTATSP
jgi:RNA polymerase sigma factor (sigma-70 family)